MKKKKQKKRKMEFLYPSFPLPRFLRRSIERACNPVPGERKYNRCARICSSELRRAIGKAMTAREKYRHKKFHS